MKKKKGRRITPVAPWMQQKIIVAFLDAAFLWPFSQRLKFAWAIVRGRIKCK